MYQSRSYTASQLPNVGYVNQNFGSDFNNSQQALGGRTQRAYTLAGANAANQIGGSGGAAYRSLLGAQGATAAAGAQIDALSQRQAQDLNAQQLRLQGGIAQNEANQNAWNAGEQSRQYGNSSDQQNAQFLQSQGQQDRQFTSAQNQQNSQFGRSLAENSRQFGVTSGNQSDQFTRSLDSNNRQFDAGQRGNILSEIIGNQTSLGFDALSNLPPELAGLLQNYLGSLGGGAGTGTGTTGKPATPWKPTSGTNPSGGANTPYAPYSGPYSPYASPPPNYGPSQGSGGYGFNPYAPRTQNRSYR